METSTRDLVASRARHRCEYCHLPAWADPHGAFHLEHVVAKQHGGGDALDNLAWSCSRCNRRKGTNLTSMDVEGNSIVELFNPRRHDWADHFAVRRGRIVGRTPVGRATVRLLDMNSPHRVELRRELIRHNWFE